MKFIRSKKFIIPLVLILLISGFGYRSYSKKNQPPTYETIKVERQKLIQTVEGTGKIESVNALTLRFEVPGRIERVHVNEGQSVKAGEQLASLKLADLNAAVAQAQANLNQKLAGATDEEKRFYKAAVDSAKAALDQARTDAANASVNMVTTLHASLPKFDDALTQADNILGMDNTYANEEFRSFLSVRDPNALTRAYSNYAASKRNRDNAKSLITTLTTASDLTSVRETLGTAEEAFISESRLLSDVSDVLKGSITGHNFTQAVLDAKKTVIETTRASFAAQYSAFIRQRQLMGDAENNIRIKEAAYNQAVANYEARVNPPREVDIAAFRAALDQAIASRDKAIINAPIDGVVTKVNKKVGETISGADTIVEMLSPHYEIKVDIAETDVTKLQVEDPAEITLDAFGDETKFSGKVISIDPSSTEIQDVVYYRVTVSLGDSEKIKPGMTANVSVKTEELEGVLAIPFRSVRTNGNGEKFVRILKNGQVSEKTVVLGFRGDEGKVAVQSGLEEGDEVVLATR